MNRLRAYRYLERLPQTDLAERLGIPRPAMSNMEHGRRSNDRVPPSTLGYGDQPPPPMTGTAHPPLTGTKVADLNQAAELLRLTGETIAALTEPKRLLPSGAPATVDAATAAAAVRFRFAQSADGPICDMGTVAGNAGVALIPLHRVRQMSAWVDGVPIIGYDPGHDREQSRWVIAHELGHLVLHNGNEDRGVAESEADRFAHALLIPPDAFSHAMTHLPDKMSDFARLADTWGIQIRRAVERARDEEWITSRRAAALRPQISTANARRPAPGPGERDWVVNDLVTANGGTVAAAGAAGINPEHLALLLWDDTRVGGTP